MGFNNQKLFETICDTRSFLCVGLDTDIEKIPSHLLSTNDPIFEFNKAIIDATSPFCVAYKPNIAFYEAMGTQGWESLKKTLEYIPKDKFTIADAKRGDIGNTSALYARAFFKTFNFDSVTVAPYMGEDSVTPFLGYKDKYVILLGLTSNKGSSDFQHLSDKQGRRIYEHVLSEAQKWANPDQLMFVIGATHPEAFQTIRSIAPNNFFLVPGVGAQGGSLEGVCEFGLNQQVGLLVNSSRGIIYASSGRDFAQAAAQKAKGLQIQMESILRKKGIIES